MKKILRSYAALALAVGTGVLVAPSAGASISLPGGQCHFELAGGLTTTVYNLKCESGASWMVAPEVSYRPAGSTVVEKDRGKHIGANQGKTSSITGTGTWMGSSYDAY
jgi:hypothetical protein